MTQQIESRAIDELICPHCDKDCSYLNIGRNHWGFCEGCKLKWHFGSNLFSSWREQNPPEWQENAAFLDKYAQVDLRNRQEDQAELDFSPVSEDLQDFEF